MKLMAILILNKSLRFCQKNFETTQFYSKMMGIFTTVISSLTVIHDNLISVIDQRKCYKVTNGYSSDGILTC